MDREELKEKLILLLIFSGLFTIMVIIALSIPYKEICICKQDKCVVKSYYLQNYYDINYFDRTYSSYIVDNHRVGRKGGPSYSLVIGSHNVFISNYSSFRGAQKDLSKIQRHNDVEIVKINWYQNFIKNLIGWMYLTVDK